MFGDLTRRTPRMPDDYHTTGTVVKVTATEAVVEVSKTLTHRCKLPGWVTRATSSEGDPGHTHNAAGPVVGDVALVLVKSESTWLLSWRAS